MSMTKKHYKAIADIIKMALEDTRPEVETVASMLASYFAEDNQNFQRAKFLEACGMRSRANGE